MNKVFKLSKFMNQSAKPEISELQSHKKYQIIEKFSHDEVIAITRKYLFRVDLPTIIYLFVNICATLFGIYNIFKSDSPLADKLSFFGVGFLFAFLFLLLVHEYIHYFAYKMLGAKNVRVQYKWRQITAFCIADRFVVSGKNFVFVALAPFFVINSIILLICFSSSANVQIFLSGALILHIGATSGDVGLTNLVWLLRGSQTWTFDDEAAQISYFFKENKD